MEQHKGYWISGTARPGPPNTAYCTPGGAVLFQRANGSVVELARFTLHSFDVADQDEAAWFGVELARLVVDTCYSELVTKQRDVERRINKPPYRR
jgi:hypothetical protein